jgi:hypothetical protein
VREIRSQIEIAAPAAGVWQILTDFEAYPAWNPFIVKVSGRPEVGARLRAQFRLRSGPGMTFRPRVTKVEAERELRWFGSLVIPGIFEGEHIFLIEPLDEGRVRFRQEERFTGVLVPLFGFFIGSTRKGFERMNEALKSLAESVSVTAE